MALFLSIIKSPFTLPSAVMFPASSSGLITISLFPDVHDIEVPAALGTYEMKSESGFDDFPAITI